tara:strand:+ start:190 stop:648 length:459 start_codon:yes stop_codon:yes gene_type:complete
MSEIYDDYLARKLTSVEKKLLTDEEKKERVKAQKRINTRNYKNKNPQKTKDYYQENIEKFKEYNQTPAGKKIRTISSWTGRSGLQESPENLDRIYNLWLTQELCNACDCVLTRDGIRCPTQASMDHCHISHRFRHIICSACNAHDNWKKHFC